MDAHPCKLEARTGAEAARTTKDPARLLRVAVLLLFRPALRALRLACCPRRFLRSLGGLRFDLLLLVRQQRPVGAALVRLGGDDKRPELRVQLLRKGGVPNAPEELGLRHGAQLG